jgi:hypothetical protein
MAAFPEASRCGRALDEEHRSSEVRAERLVPGIGGELTERERECVGGVVHDDVQPPELVDCAVDERFDRTDVPHVRGHPDGITAHRAQVGLCGRARVRLAARHRHLGAGGEEALGDGESDPPGAAGHDGHATGQVVESAELLSVHVLSCSCTRAAHWRFAVASAVR